MDAARLELLIVPAYDEAERLPALLAELRRSLPELAVLVIDDGSRDATAAVAARAGARVVRHPFNLGYGAALQTGYKYALAHGTERLVQMDADGQHLPAEVPAQAVADHVDAKLRIDDERVFVLLAHQADVAAARAVDPKGHGRKNL